MGELLRSSRDDARLIAEPMAAMENRGHGWRHFAVTWRPGPKSQSVPRRVVECGNVLHSGLPVEIGGKEPACFIREPGIDAVGGAGRLSEIKITAC